MNINQFLNYNKENLANCSKVPTYPDIPVQLKYCNYLLEILLNQ